MPRWLLPVAIGAALIGSHWFAYSQGISAEEARRDAEGAKNSLYSERMSRSSELKSQAEIDKIGELANEDLEKARADAAIALSAANGLRSEARRIATKLAICDSSIAAERSARERAAIELANILAEMESEGRTLAEAATRGRASGLACESSYDAVRNINQK